jgi:hypothetical protein
MYKLLFESLKTATGLYSEAKFDQLPSPETTDCPGTPEIVRI